MDVFLIRHAHAGDRLATHHDRYRPLSGSGRERAAELAGQFEPTSVGVVLSSPATRCVQTVEPLAKSRDLEVEEHADLFEGARIEDVLRLLSEQLGPQPIVACSHGDIIPEIIDSLARDGVPINGRGCEKGAVWRLVHDGRTWTSASRWPPGG